MFYNIIMHNSLFDSRFAELEKQAEFSDDFHIGGLDPGTVVIVDFHVIPSRGNAVGMGRNRIHNLHFCSFVQKHGFFRTILRRPWRRAEDS